MSVSEHDTQLLMLVIPNNSDFGLQVLDRKVNSMKRKAHQKIPCGKTADEKPKFGTSYHTFHLSFFYTDKIFGE